MEPNGLKYAGVDGCRKGWFLVSIDEHCLNFSFAIFGDIKTLWLTTQQCERILIDIPIGLSNSKPRLCDVFARKLLHTRGSSVFPTPTRNAVYASNYEDAKGINFKLSGKKISQQAWNISRKIREVDEFLAASHDAHGKIRESHPEICFWALAGGKPMAFPKKSEQGIKERLQLLQTHCQIAEAIFLEAKQKYLRKDLALDDILDAIVLAITAASPIETIGAIPEIPERDDRNIAMEIVYTNRYLN